MRYPHLLLWYLIYMSHARKSTSTSRAPIRSFLKYSFFLITIISTGVFVTTGKPLVLIGEALRTIAPHSIASVYNAFVKSL